MINKSTHNDRMDRALVAAAVVLAVTVAVLVTVRAARSEPATVYGKDGSFQGQVHTYGNTQTFTGQNGQFTGSSITHGNTTTLYDRNGHFQGSVVQPGTPSNPLSGGRR